MEDSMLIDGLIKFCDEKSKNIKLKAEPQVFVEIKQALEELKAFKLGNCTNDCKHYDSSFEYVRNKAIDEFVKTLKEKYGCLGYIDGIAYEEIDEITEQMKAGVKNE